MTKSVSIRSRQWLAGIAAFLLALLIAAAFVTYRESEEAKDSTDIAMQQADAYADQIVARLTPLQSVAQAVRADILANDYTTDPAELQRFLDVLHSSLGGAWFVAAAPNNRVVAIAPREGNEAVLGLFYPETTEQWPSVREAMETRSPVLVGPVDIVQGGQAFIYRTPVFLDDGRYWGVISTATDEATLLAPPPGTSPGEGAAVAVRNGEGAVVAGDPVVFDGAYATAMRTGLGATWEVAVTVTSQPTPFRVGRAILVTFVALALGFLTFLLAGARRREKEMSLLMRDVSTQAPGILFELRGERDGAIRLSYASPAIETMLGVQPVEGKYDQDTLKALVNPDDYPAIREALTASVLLQQPWRQRFRVQLADGTKKVLLVNASATALPTGDVIWHGWASDATQDIEDEAALRVSASLFEVTRDAVAILDVNGVVTFTNPGFEAVTGFSLEQAVGLPFQSLLGDVTPEPVLADVTAQLDRYGYWSGELSIRAADGSVRTDAAAANAVRDADGNVSHFVIVLDNTNLTRDDPVTGLPHARLLDESLRLAHDREPASASLGYVILGLDGFRSINDAYGHRVGDRLLRDVGERLRDALPSTVPLVRLRGDEFAFVVRGDVEVGEIEILAERCLASLAAPFDIAGLLLRTSAAAGLAVGANDPVDAAELHLHANQAMRAAKQSGANQLRFFNTAMQDKASERATLRHELDEALDAGQLHVAFQPIVDLHTNDVHRAEALIRWDHPTRGPIAPDVFIAIAEQAGLIGVLGDIAFSASVDALVALQRIDPSFQVSVNLSPIELREPGNRHANRIELVRAAGIPGSAVIAEITEGTLLITDDVVDRNLNSYRAEGMQFAIDDFGTGYSSLAYLQRLDVQYLKIDQSFIEGLAPGSGSLALCQAIIVMASKLGLEVVAEGVETQEQNDLLIQSGCRYAQGYLHARPMPIEALTDWLAARR